MGVLEGLLVVVFLVTGLISFAGGSGQRTDRSEMFMKLRVISQAVAILLIALLVYFSR
jgi:hypothetical protein